MLSVKLKIVYELKMTKNIQQGFSIDKGKSFLMYAYMNGGFSRVGGGGGGGCPPYLNETLVASGQQISEMVNDKFNLCF